MNVKMETMEAAMSTRNALTNRDHASVSVKTASLEMVSTARSLLIKLIPHSYIFATSVGVGAYLRGAALSFLIFFLSLPFLSPLSSTFLILRFSFPPVGPYSLEPAEALGALYAPPVRSGMKSQPTDLMHSEPRKSSSGWNSFCGF